jgi:hypothetical protein
MKHVRTSPYYPQSNGKIERYHRTIKSQCIRPLTPLSLDDAKRGVEKFVIQYNTVRLHSAVGYVTPQAMLEGRQQAIFDERDRKLTEARQRRAETRAAARNKANANSSLPPDRSYTESDVAEDRALLGSTSSAAPLPLTNVGSGLSEITSNSAAITTLP